MYFMTQWLCICVFIWELELSCFYLFPNIDERLVKTLRRPRKIENLNWNYIHYTGTNLFHFTKFVTTALEFLHTRFSKVQVSRVLWRKYAQVIYVFIHSFIKVNKTNHDKSGAEFIVNKSLLKRHTDYWWKNLPLLLV